VSPENTFRAGDPGEVGKPPEAPPNRPETAEATPPPCATPVAADDAAAASMEVRRFLSPTWYRCFIPSGFFNPPDVVSISLSSNTSIGVCIFHVGILKLAPAPAVPPPTLVLAPGPEPPTPLGLLPLLDIQGIAEGLRGASPCTVAAAAVTLAIP